MKATNVGRDAPAAVRYRWEVGGGVQVVAVCGREARAPASRVARREWQSHAARHLLEQLICAEFGADAVHWTLAGRGGPPQLIGPAAPAVSLGHSGEWLAGAAATGGRVGADVEVMRARDWSAAADLVWQPQDRDWLDCGSAEQRLWKGYCLWTLREAWIKALGAEPDGALVDIHALPERAPGAESLALGRGLRRAWIACPAPGIMFALAWAGAAG